MSSTGQSRQGSSTKVWSSWARRLKRRLENAGYKVIFLDSAQAAEKKNAFRREDAELLKSRRITPQELQRRNSVFGGKAKSFRIVDYGGLNDGD